VLKTRSSKFLNAFAPRNAILFRCSNQDLPRLLFHRGINGWRVNQQIDTTRESHRLPKQVYSEKSLHYNRVRSLFSLNHKCLCGNRFSGADMLRVSQRQTFLDSQTNDHPQLENFNACLKSRQIVSKMVWTNLGLSSIFVVRCNAQNS